MARRFYELPPLTMLNTFEAAARLESFKEASLELNVTPGAVSHQIKALEQDLGVTVFERAHRSVILTQEGHILFDALERSFSSLSLALRKVRRMQNTPSVNIGASTAVSSLWLTPRITQFWKKHGNITVNQQVSDQPFSKPLSQDMVVEYGLRRESETTQLLFTDHLVPVCSPEFAAKTSGIELGELAECPLIHLDAPDHNWTTWVKWFETLGYHGPIRSGQRVNNYSIALQLARDSSGVVLGWKRLIAPLLDRGVLVSLGGYHTKAPGAFYLHSGEHELSQDAHLFRNWLINDEMNSPKAEHKPY